jgi:hypothetical protein
MPNADYSGARLKVERAEKHIADLETIFRHFVHENVKRLRPERKHRLLKGGQIARPATFPKHTPTILGDALHNLRAALDYTYHVAAEANHAAFDRFRRFPFGQDRQSVEGSINGHKLKGIAPSDAVIGTILDEIQPYESGKFGLYGLHRLDITDKHLVLIPTLSEMAIQGLDFVDETGAKTGGGIYGITLVIDQGKGGEFTSPGGAVLHGDPKDTFQICFGDGQPFEGERILDTVQSLKTAVVEALDLIENATR